MILKFLIGALPICAAIARQIFGPPAISEIDRNTLPEQSEALIWRLPAEQVIEWRNFNMGAPRHYLECNSVKRLPGLSNN